MASLSIHCEAVTSLPRFQAHDTTLSSTPTYIPTFQAIPIISSPSSQWQIPPLEIRGFYKCGLPKESSDAAYTLLRG